MKKIIMIFSSLLFVFIVFLNIDFENKSNKQISPDNKILNVIASSGLEDIEPSLKRILENTGVRLSMTYMPTMDASIEIINNPTKYDVAWLSETKYLDLLEKEYGQKILLKKTPIAESPLVLGMKAKLREDLLEKGMKADWKVLAKLAKEGDFKYAMSDPTSSNTGFLTTLMIDEALKDSNENLTRLHIKNFYLGKNLTAPSSKELMNKFFKEKDFLDGIFLYENMVMELNEMLEEDLMIVYPKKEMIVPDFSFSLLNVYKDNSYDIVSKYLLSDDYQNWLMTETNRRPLKKKEENDAFFKRYTSRKVDFPQTLDSVKDILNLYLDDFKKPNTLIYVIDVSGKDGTKKLELTKEAIKSLSVDFLDDDVGDNYFQFRENEKLIIIPFDNIVKKPMFFDLKNVNGKKNIEMFLDNINGHGEPALYDSLHFAYNLALHLREKEPDRVYSIMLLTDGINKGFVGLKSFESNFKKLDAEGIRTFPILLNSRKEDEMKKIAEMTGGTILPYYSKGENLKDLIVKLRRSH